jgi:UDP-N-acetylmuramate dehydrogenase
VIASPTDARWRRPARRSAVGWLADRARRHSQGQRRGPVGVSTAHALALVHLGGGSTAALLELAREVRDAVHARFAMTLLPEPTMIGVAWPTTEI